MTRNFPDWAYLVDEKGRFWYHLGDGTRLPVDGENGVRAPGKCLFAIATNDLVSIPQWVSSKDPAIISQVIEVEISKLGFQRNGGPGKVTDWKPVEINGTRTLVQSVATPWRIEDLENSPSRSEFVDFFPQYALYSPPEDSAVLWKEGDVWVAGYSRGKRWVHVQTLGGDEMLPLLAGEINLTLIELAAKGLLVSASRVVAWAPYELSLHRSLQEETGLPVTFESRPIPSPQSALPWDFEPHEITRERLDKIRRRRAVALAFLALFVVLALAATAVLHLWQLGNANERLRSRIESNRSAAEKIDSAINRWRTLEPAIDPSRSPVEIFHQVALLLPEKGLRLTSFEIRDSRVIEIRAEGATMTNALQIKGAFEKSPELSKYAWEVPQPRAKDDITEIFATGTYRF